ncbi:hypothetical protein DAEQUDRAFT_754453 [Daedalea quercina L-15889]|uniref:Uncharacterized protein n=1 Tax=Daedalea quercina L-15889 TaxID=1314783 RepID=A0A165TLR6_9APHY|nr:hypothetical protein DAEQUDRAFT_754453 [Daedalea quercina L-15889]
MDDRRTTFTLVVVGTSVGVGNYSLPINSFDTPRNQTSDFIRMENQLHWEPVAEQLRVDGKQRNANSDLHPQCYRLQLQHRLNRFKTPVFTTKVAITSYDFLGVVTSGDGRSYPFDKYLAYVNFARSASEHRTVSIGIIGSNGIAVGFNVVYDNSDSWSDSDDIGDMGHGVNEKVFTIARGQVIRIYVVLIVIAIWMITMTFVVTCIVTVIFGKGVRSEVMVLPIATLFAFIRLHPPCPVPPTVSTDASPWWKKLIGKESSKGVEGSTSTITSSKDVEVGIITAGTVKIRGTIVLRGWHFDNSPTDLTHRV